MNKKDVKITKQSHAFKGYRSSYNVVALSSFNPSLQLQNTASAIENKLLNLLAELKGFKFVITLVRERYQNKIWHLLFKLKSRSNC